MRKDVKFALIIGAVFLAVLIVYISVMSPDKGRNNDVTLVTDGASTPAPAVTTPPPAPAPAYVRPRPAPPANPVASERSRPAPAPVVAPTPATPMPAVADHSNDAAPPPARSPRTPAVAAAGQPAADPWQSALEYGMLEAVQPAVEIRPEQPTPTDSPVIDTQTPDPDPAQQLASQVQIPPGNNAGASSAAMTPLIQTPAPTTHPVQANTGAGSHVVAPGETFSSIALSVYGASKYWNRIAEANPNVDPKSLRPGTILIVPAFSAPVEPAAPAALPAVDPKTEYRVQQGDSLYKIAIRLFNNGQFAGKIYELNKAVIGPDPAKLKLGTVLKLPPAPAAAAPTPAAPR